MTQGNEAAGPGERRRLGRGDAAVLVAFALVFFGLSLVRGRELSVHEAVLAESASVMAAGDDLVVPRRGGAPWLETPPLPHWIAAAATRAAGGERSLCAVRLGSALMGVLLTLAAASIGGTLFGRAFGWLGGAVTATSYEVVRYAWLAEDDVHLAALVALATACVVRVEFGARGDEPERPGPLGRRRPAVVATFALAGLAGLVKGFVFGPAMVALPLCVHLAWNGDRRALARWAWAPGVALALGVAAAWPVLAWRREPDVLALWDLDLFGRLGGRFDAGGEPPWYYALVLPMVLAPWVLLAPLGFVAARRAWRGRGTPERFVVGWALAVPVLLSIPSWKHHHYLLPCVVPWALLAALGLARVARSTRARVGVVATVAVLQAGVAWFHEGTHAPDARYLRAVAATEPRDEPIYADLDVGEMRGFHVLFHLGERAVPLHDLTFLRDERIEADSILVVTRYRKRAELERLGTPALVSQSERTGRSRERDDLTSLFRLALDPARERHPADGVRVSPLQAMGREDGPHLGAPLD